MVIMILNKVISRWEKLRNSLKALSNERLRRAYQDIKGALSWYFELPRQRQNYHKLE